MDANEAQLTRVTSQLTDCDITLDEEEVDAIVGSIIQHNVHGDVFRSMMGFSAFSGHDRAAQQRSSFLYQQWLRGA